MICGACGQDRHPVIEGDQKGRFQYTCGNSECHAFIKLHERSEPAVAVAPVVSAATDHVVTLQPRTVAATQAYVEKRTVDDAVTTLEVRLAEVDAFLETVPALKAEQKRLRRMLAAARPSQKGKPAVNRDGHSLGYYAEPKAHQ